MYAGEEQTQPRIREFQAVVLAGHGEKWVFALFLLCVLIINSLQPLTHHVGGNTASKALLPVGNRPMISHVLHWIEDCGISGQKPFVFVLLARSDPPTDVLVVCPSVLKPEISHHLHRSEYSNMQLDLKSVDEDDLALTGTAQVLREIEALIKVCAWLVKGF
jgi:translation initiation factor eIF-2B subunit gamma